MADSKQTNKRPTIAELEERLARGENVEIAPDGTVGPPAAPWEDLFEGVSRLKVPGGYIYDIKGKGLVFTPGA